MISVQEAYNRASCFSMDYLPPKAFDCGDFWVFEYEDSELVGGWPIIVNKTDGLVYTMGAKKTFSFWAQKRNSFPVVEVKEHPAEAKNK